MLIKILIFLFSHLNFISYIVSEVIVLVNELFTYTYTETYMHNKTQKHTKFIFITKFPVYTPYTQTHTCTYVWYEKRVCR